MDRIFTNTFVSTIGIDFKFKTMEIEDIRVRLQICDTAGQERFLLITWSFYCGTEGFIFVFGLDDLNSFAALDS